MDGRTDAWTFSRKKSCWICKKRDFSEIQSSQQGLFVGTDGETDGHSDILKIAHTQIRLGRAISLTTLTSIEQSDC